ncbi:hypothetical protein [Haloarcula marina]|uniref:hypothetical protein n=1 Tax=Haloarcula marina TaxID=2961574 RepID=UPI0020B82381|nr:hypothetical protein [Halomicroarcula marina]
MSSSEGDDELTDGGVEEAEVRTYGIKEEVVRECVGILESESYNTFLLPYLIYRKLTYEEAGCCESYCIPDDYPTVGPTENELLELFNQFINVPGNEEGDEYYRPWAVQSRNMWTGDHVAGRLAHSTTSGTMPSTSGPFVAVAPDQPSSPYDYILEEDHASNAVEEFNKGDKFAFYPLAGYLLRNFVIDREEEPDRDTVVATFRSVFCFPKQEDGSEHSEFETLFDTENHQLDEHPYEVIS